MGVCRTVVSMSANFDPIFFNVIDDASQDLLNRPFLRFVWGGFARLNETFRPSLVEYSVGQAPVMEASRSFTSEARIPHPPLKIKVDQFGAIPTPI
jgi:hypothetical protein